MGQTQGSPPPREVLRDVLLRLPPSWLQALRQALNEVEMVRREATPATVDIESPAPPPPPPRSTAMSSSEVHVDVRVRRTDLRCGVPCISLPHGVL